jgi:acetyl esterase/lipase
MNMSREQREAVAQLLREGPLDIGGDVYEQRVIFERMMTARPLPADVSTRQDTLAGLPPLLVQAGSDEILLDDATRLAARAAASDVAVTLQVTPGVPHVFQGFAAVLDEGATALANAGAFLRGHLTAV